jgi:glycosyltransferase involved in cell wall biosynthesis
MAVSITHEQAPPRSFFLRLYRFTGFGFTDAVTARRMRQLTSCQDTDVSRPLVSVMIPCFNAAETLKLAAASLTAQTIDDWECICLDDGSSDATWDVLCELRARDSRFRIERFAENRGRGAARQRILELITGKYLAFQDADDWSYPDRFEHEMSWLELDAHIAMVSACAAVTREDEPIGVFRPRPGSALPCVLEFDRPVPPPMLFPSSMIRADLAKQTGFDTAFRRSQDSDFVLRAVLGKHLALTSRVVYSYSSAASTLAATLEGYKYRLRSHLRHWRAHPIRVTRTLVETTAKIAAYRGAAVVGAEQRLIERRFFPIDQEIIAGFEAARATVCSAAARLFAA